MKYDLYFSNFYIAQSLLSILKFFRPVKNPTVQYKNACEIHMGIGACYVLTKSFLKVFENLHYPHFLYGEEAFFSNQIHSDNGILWFDPSLIVRHAESAATSKMPKRFVYEYAKNAYKNYRSYL